MWEKGILGILGALDSWNSNVSALSSPTLRLLLLSLGYWNSQFGKKLGFFKFPKVDLFVYQMKRFFQGSDSSDYSNSQHCFEMRHNNNRLMLSSPLTRNHEHDDDISGTEAMLRRRKLPKTTDPFVPPSSLKMTWSKKDEILILSVCNITLFTVYFLHTCLLLSIFYI